MTTTERPRILKSHAARDRGAGVVFNFEDLRARCDAHVEQVRQQTQQMIDNARAEAESTAHRLLEDARQEGQKEGLREANQEIERRSRQLAEKMSAEKLHATLPALRQAAEELHRERDRWLTEWEATAIQLCISVAERILHQRLAVQPDLVLPMMSEVLQLAAGNPEISLKMHPDDVALLGDRAVEIVRGQSGCAEVNIIADPDITRGGCLVESRHGEIDARIEKQLDRIAAELLEQDLDLPHASDRN